ncbi:hypothetical protein O3G_MSEX003561 [Manduca sexta]|uniref:Uncharacterized protein n=1 Tax=Manduca sexta TaxID=7130 RepID=A0A921YSG0_MANSE|nr:hypothetical protein O3G_MSEX003561 [Manduca sexta]
MSQVFHKSCYTARSTGYKYRTLSTNTGDKKRRDSIEDNSFDKKLKELKHEITSRIDKELDQAQKARSFINEKLEKIEAKINSMVELQNSVATMRQDLHVAESTLTELVDRIGKLDIATYDSELYCLQSQRELFLSQSPILEEKGVFAPNITHIL